MQPPTPATLARHGLTEDAWRRLLAHQGERCGVCRKPVARGGRFVIDHDHKTGRVRGLCHPLCNGKLGKVRDDVAWLQGAWEYLTNPPAAAVLRDDEGWSKATPKRRRRRNTRGTTRPSS